MAVVANDSFTATNGTDITARASDSGHTWTIAPGSSGAVTIQSNTAVDAGFNGPKAYSSFTPTSADYTVSLDVTADAAGSYVGGPGARIDTATGTGYYVYWNGGAGEWRLEGAATIGTYVGDVPTTTRTVTLDVSGSTIRVLIGGVQRISVTNTSYTAAGRPGAYFIGGSAARTHDNWTVEEASPPPTSSLIPGAPIMGGIYGRGQGFFKPGALASQVPRNRAAQDVAYDAVFRPAAGGPTIVSGSQAGAWSVSNLISTTKAGAWSVRNLAATTTSGAWSVRASVSASAGGAWSARNLATTTAGGAWSVRNLASASAAGAWSVRNLVATTASGAWSVSSVLPIVSTTLDGAWSVRAAVASSQAGAWSVRNLAGTTQPGAWSVRNLAAGSAASAWSVRNLSSTTASGAWSVRAAVGTSVAGAWSVRAAVGSSATGAWSVRNLAAGSVGAAWSVRNRVAGSKAGAWSVLAAGGYPDPADVRYGVQYGPTGTEYTGTMRGAGVVLIRRR